MSLNYFFRFQPLVDSSKPVPILSVHRRSHFWGWGSGGAVPIDSFEPVRVINALSGEFTNLYGI